MLNFKPISEAENSAPHCFNLDPDGYTLPSALELRALPAAFFVKDEDGNSTTTVSDPRLEKLEEWIADPDHPVEETERTLLTLYASLAPAEYLYVAELVRVYDATRCYFLQWVVGGSVREFVNGNRLAALRDDQPYLWHRTSTDIMSELTDLTAATRLARFVMTTRPPKQSAKLWINHQLATRALLECPTTDPHHPTEPITLPEWIYLEFTLGQLTDEELRAFKLPGLGENLLEKKGDGGLRWTMGELQASVNAVVHPPPVTRRETPITKLVYLLSNPLKPRERGDNWQPRQEPPRPRGRTKRSPTFYCM